MKKVYAVVCFLSFVIGFIIWENPVLAATNYSVKGPNQPYFHGFNAEQMKNWSPEQDVTAKYFRSDTPIVTRNKPYPQTQAQPALKHKAKLLTLSGDYGDPGYGYEKGIPDFTRTVAAYARNVFQFWQYTDYYASWNGTPVAGTNYADIKNNNNLTYGVVNYPNPAYTDAAHKNGVKSLGGWFWPRNEDFSKWVEQNADGSFPVADKMIAMARYMNFDGYFINQEAAISRANAQKLQQMLVYLKRKAPDLYIQFYDSLTKDGRLHYVNGFNESNSYWVKDARGQAADSIFMNYAWNTNRLKNGNEYAKLIDLDPLQVMFAGTENQKYGFNPPYDPREIFTDFANPYSSWALFGSDFVYSRYPGNNLLNENQAAIKKREREYWSGPNENPTLTGRLTEENSSPYPDQGRPNDPDNPAHWDGVANFIPEKTVIKSAPFITDFNIGHGTAFFKDGKKVAANEWSNIGGQDILPSWQWWKSNKLAVQFDTKKAWNGGSSLKINTQTKKAILHLFKTDIPLSGNEKITTQTLGNLSGTASLVLTFKDELQKPITFQLSTSNADKWQKTTIDLAPYKGKEIGRISLQFDTNANSELYLGELALTSKDDSLTGKPTFKVDRYLRNSGEAFVQAGMTKDVLYYDVYSEDGQFISRINSENSYVQGIAKDATKLIIQPVSSNHLDYSPITLQLP